jgi:hypothetical protein
MTYFSVYFAWECEFDHIPKLLLLAVFVFVFVFSEAKAER